MSQDLMGLKKLFLILNPSHQIFLRTGFREKLKSTYYK